MSSRLECTSVLRVSSNHCALWSRFYGPPSNRRSLKSPTRGGTTAKTRGTATAAAATQIRNVAPYFKRVFWEPFSHHMRKRFSLKTKPPSGLIFFHFGVATGPKKSNNELLFITRSNHMKITPNLLNDFYVLWNCLHKSRRRDVGWPLLMINKFLKDVFYGKFGWSLTPLTFGRSIISYGCIFRFCKKNSRTYYNWMSSSSTRFTLRSDGNPALFAFNCDTFKIIVFFFFGKFSM